MPGLSITHQSLNSGKNEKPRKWKWPKWLKKRKSSSATTSPQKVEDEDSTNQSLGIETFEANTSSV